MNDQDNGNPDIDWSPNLPCKMDRYQRVENHRKHTKNNHPYGDTTRDAKFTVREKRRDAANDETKQGVVSIRQRK